MEWWNSLTYIEQILYCIAIPSTLLLLVQTIMLLSGFGGDGEGMNPSDTSGLDMDMPDSGDFNALDAGGGGYDGASPGDFGIMSLFTMQGIITFLTIFAWSALVMVRSELHIAPAIILSGVIGFLAMWGVGRLIHTARKLSHNGTINLKLLIGEQGTVYIPIPPSGYGYGKVTIQLAERFLECTATSDDGSFERDEQIRVVDIRAGNILVVEKV